MKIKERKIDFYFWLEDLFWDIGWWFGDKARKYQDEMDLEWAQEMFKDSDFKIIKKL